jgi:hypothetical protein
LREDPLDLAFLDVGEFGIEVDAVHAFHVHFEMAAYAGKMPVDGAP